MKFSTRLVYALMMLILPHCTDGPVKISVPIEEEEKKPPPPPNNFGVVTAFREQAVNVKAVYTDDNVYKLLQDAITPKGHFSDSEKLKLLNITTPDIRQYISSGSSLSKYYSTQDSVDFLSNTDAALYIFDSSRLNNVICISVAEYLHIFSKNNCDDNWKAFIKKYGHYGLHYFSVPTFNRSHTKALMISGGNGACRIGSKELLLLEMIKGKWKIRDEETLEIN